MKTRTILNVFVSACLLTFLFHKQHLGINLLIVSIVFLFLLFLKPTVNIKNKYAITTGAGFFIASLFSVLTYSTFAIILNFLMFLVLVGYMVYPETKSILNSIGQAFSNIIYSVQSFFRELSGSKLKGRKVGTYLFRLRIFIIPIAIIFIFIAIYRNSNPIFDGAVDKVESFLCEKYSFIFKDFDFTIILTFLLCMFLSIYLLFRTVDKKLKQKDLESDENLVRIKKRNRDYTRTNALKNEYKSGVFLLMVLNALILILNVIDVKWVWFGFEWEGQYLKQFVHEGTYLLILSILISIALVLYFFRKNINFLPNNKLLRVLSYAWLIQNAVLAISVGIRNFWYIKYFALAYKRIGVIIFLILTLYGLYTVYVKVRERKSSFYLFKTNTYSILVVLVLSSLVNWDSLIAKYNFKHSNHSFLHLDYLSTLSDKSLPYLDYELEELNEIDSVQKELFPFEKIYMTPEKYVQVIDKRKVDFKEKWENKRWMSWNLPEYQAYRQLFQEE